VEIDYLREEVAPRHVVREERPHDCRLEDATVQRVEKRQHADQAPGGRRAASGDRRTNISRRG